jgi:hypothetical protein
MIAAGKRQVQHALCRGKCLRINELRRKQQKKYEDQARRPE